ncbi:MAG: hypothetical protein BWY35_01890 [Firmicutes bacterium ADurb.Bin248]|nr:MAG: hypothetical protein BWY35_01890 [Firmicutes bacterium ADurb.Bin248]
MSFMDVTCRDSFSLPNCAGCSGCGGDMLRVGCGYETYLYFELPPAVWLGRLQKARLFLFKISADAAGAPLSKIDRYRVCPLLDFASVFGDCFAPPGIDERLCAPFEDDSRRSYTEIDVTGIAKAWTLEKPENKGLVLSGHPSARPLVYASNRFAVAGMRPTLRLSCEGFTRPLSVAEAVAEVR